MADVKKGRPRGKRLPRRLACVAGAKRGGRWGGRKAKTPSVFPFFPIPYPFRRLLRRLTPAKKVVFHDGFFPRPLLIGTLNDTRSRQWGDSTSDQLTKASNWCLNRKRKKYTLSSHKAKKVLRIADFDGWDLVENVICLVFARLFTLFFSFSLFICLNGTSVHTYERWQFSAWYGWVFTLHRIALAPVLSPQM